MRPDRNRKNRRVYSPLVELLSHKKSNRQYIRVLILTPTRELANQVGEIAKAYTRVVSMRCTVVYGGVRIKPQADRIKRGIDILVATPGRLLDLVEQKYLNLSHIEFLVFDEADRMLDLGFSDEVSRILDHVPVKPIDCHIINFTRLEGGRRIVILQRPITQ